MVGGWGGVMLTFLALVNMVAATQDVGWCVGWGGVMLTFLALVNMAVKLGPLRAKLAS